MLSPSFHGAIRDLFQAFALLLWLFLKQSSTIMVIFETKASGMKAKSITNRLPLHGAIHANNFGLSRGL